MEFRSPLAIIPASNSDRSSIGEPLINVPSLKPHPSKDPNQSAEGTNSSRMNRNISTRSKGPSSGLSVPSGSSEYSTIGKSHGVVTSSDLYTKQYFTRATSLDQMDMQAALDQMRTILSFAPQRVYKTSYYRKQTKNHWARDDPAFAVLEIMFISVASVAYCIAFKQPNLIASTITFALQHIVGVFVGCGAIIATIGQVVANAYLSHHVHGNGSGSGGAGGGQERTGLSSHHVQQRVEWMYAFDIHCNAFLPLFVMLCKSAWCRCVVLHLLS